jgi:hypothetical protein
LLVFRPAVPVAITATEVMNIDVVIGAFAAVPGSFLVSLETESWAALRLASGTLRLSRLPLAG